MNFPRLNLRRVLRYTIGVVCCVLIGAAFSLWHNPRGWQMLRQVTNQFGFCSNSTQYVSGTRWRLVLNRYDENQNLLESEDLGTGWFAIRDGRCISIVPENPEEKDHRVSRVCGNVEVLRW